MEIDPGVLERRQKEIENSKNTLNYNIYLRKIRKNAREYFMPFTPNKMKKYSGRQWDSKIKGWKKSLQRFVTAEVQKDQKSKRRSSGVFSCNIFANGIRRVFMKGYEKKRKIVNFLEEENIELNLDVEDFLGEEFDTVYENTGTAKRFKPSWELRKVNEEAEEKSDLYNEGWETVKEIKKDQARRQFAHDQFGNRMPSDPYVNLTVHGFKAAKNRTSPMFPSCLDCEEMPKIKLADFYLVMKSVFAKTYYKLVKEKKNPLPENFMAYISHYKMAQLETTNFLSYYDGKKMLSKKITEEVVDMENIFSTFKEFYGKAEAVFCKVCNKKHTFSQ